MSSGIFVSSETLEPRSSKDSGRSDENRRKGNAHFSTNNNSGFVAALWSYNRSICDAENGSKQLALGYANRSAVFIELKMYKECLENIELARNVGQYPENLNDKLAARETRCRALMAAMTPDIGAAKPELSYPPHEKIPFVANCVEIHRNVKYGRHLVTNRDLKVGDVVAIEKPFCAVFPGVEQHQRCENCTEEHSRSLIPCESCTSVMFCSVECRTEAMRSFHQYECPVIDWIKTGMVAPDFFVPIRMVLCALALFDGDSKAMFGYANEADANCDDTTVFEIDYTKRLTPFGKFAPIYCMVNANADKGDLYPPMMDVWTKIVHQASNINGQTPKRTMRHLMKIMEHFSIERVPCYRGTTTRAMMSDIAARDLGCQNLVRTFGIYPFHSLINHSCVGNVQIIAHGYQSVLVIAQPVKAGEQLLICKGALFHQKPRDERHKFQSFRCTCEACEGNYPLFRDLPCSPIRMNLTSAELKTLIMEGPLTRKNAAEYLKIVAKDLKKVVKYLPCQDWAILNSAFGRCLMAIYEKEDCDFLSLTADWYSDLLHQLHLIDRALSAH